MRIYNIFIIIFTLLLINGCKGKFETETYQLNTFLTRKNHTIINDGLYVIIPLDICKSCTNDLFYKLKNINNEHNKITIILSDMVSYNINNRKEELKKFKIIEDLKMSFFSDVSFSNGKFPLLLEIKNKKIKNITEIKLGNNDKKIHSILNNYSR